MIHRPTTLFPLFVAVATLLTIPDHLRAQRASELSQGASRVGLTRVWSKSIATGTGGKVSGVTVYVSPTKSYRGSEVVDKFGRRVFFSDRNANRAISRAGYDQTSRLTELKKAELVSRGLDPQVELKQISDVTLYVRTSLGTVTALDAETGKRQWSTQAGTAGYPSYGVSASDQYVVTLSGTTLYLLDAETGQVLDTVPTRGIPSATPTIHGDLIYSPTTKGFIDVLATEDLARREFTLGSSGRLENSLTLSPSTVSWTASDGHLYVAAVGTQGLKYRFESLDALVASPAYMGETLFVTSLDGFVVAIEEKNGEVKWRHSTGAPIREAPLAVDGNVYVTTIDGQMTALDAATGKVTVAGDKRSAICFR